MNNMLVRVDDEDRGTIPNSTNEDLTVKEDIKYCLFLYYNKE